MLPRAVICVGFLVAVLAVVEGWSAKFYDNSYGNWAPSRRSYCAGSGGKCYASGQCCKGFVCAAVDDVYDSTRVGLNPEIPGFCIKEKDLQPCDNRDDCEPGIVCATLGRTTQKYCVPRRHPGGKQESDVVAENQIGRGSSQGKNGLGMSCKDDSDCAPVTKDGKHELCCQEVRRYRQKPRKQCDRVTPISICIGGKGK